MKMQPDMLAAFTAAIRPLDVGTRRDAYRRGEFPRADATKDRDKRYRWDLAYAARVDFTAAYDAGLNDVHIDTALRSIVPPLAEPCPADGAPPIVSYVCTNCDAEMRKPTSASGQDQCTGCGMLVTPDRLYADGERVDAFELHPYYSCDACDGGGDSGGEVAHRGTDEHNGPWQMCSTCYAEALRTFDGDGVNGLGHPAIGAIVTPDTLNAAMEFDHVVRVNVDGTVSDVDGLHAPELFDHEISDPRWSPVGNYTSQQGGGWLMHNCESIGGRMAIDILAEPGVYVAIVADWPAEEDEQDTIEGWAVVKLDDANDPALIIDLDAVAAALVAQGTPAVVYHSGGGCATLGVGTPSAEDRYVIVAGPGAYSTTVGVPSVGSVGDFYIGPDDDGVSDNIVSILTPTTTAEVAFLILAAMPDPGFFLAYEDEEGDPNWLVGPFTTFDERETWADANPASAMPLTMYGPTRMTPYLPAQFLAEMADIAADNESEGQ